MRNRIVPFLLKLVFGLVISVLTGWLSGRVLAVLAPMLFEWLGFGTGGNMSFLIRPLFWLVPFLISFLVSVLAALLFNRTVRRAA